ncbi:MAG: hypothetical protein JWM80_4195 [Cyanobacteria bacterium RYN_339]|nr:hypothetical protein [Cyanobacteria bacterium RYN_339]
MADEIGPNLNAHVPILDQIGHLAPLDRARGTRPLTPQQGPRIGRDGVRLTERSRRIMQALAKGETDLDDPDYMRLRQLYQRADAPETVTQQAHGFPPELLALVQAYEPGDMPQAGLEPSGTGDLVAGALQRLRRAYYALIL